MTKVLWNSDISTYEFLNENGEYVGTLENLVAYRDKCAEEYNGNIATFTLLLGPLACNANYYGSRFKSYPICVPNACINNEEAVTALLAINEHTEDKLGDIYDDLIYYYGHDECGIVEKLSVKNPRHLVLDLIINV